MQLDQATSFARHSQQLHPLFLIQLLKSQKRLWEMLADSTVPRSQYGAPRMEGNWAAAYMAFVASRQADILPWWRIAGHSIWTESGFRERPSYPAVHERFAELEQHAEEFRLVASQLIRYAVRMSDSRIGQDLHVDSTEAETNARLHHICDPRKECWGKAPLKTRRRAMAEWVSAQASRHEVHSMRHSKAAEAEPEDLSALDLGDDSARLVTREGSKIMLFKGCAYELLDPTAGARAYIGANGKTKRFWIGFYNAKAIDHYTGAPVAVLVTSASVQEAHAYPQLYGRAFDAIGKAPRAVVADRGYSVTSVFEFNTRKGVASVMPWRVHGKITERWMDDGELVDRHGVPRCRYCGGPTRFAKFNHKDRAGPRLWVTCSLGLTPECKGKQQTFLCKENWRLLIPLWRTHEPYLVLRNTHDEYERVHHMWRNRYRVAADSHHFRPKRKGLDCQELRSQAALLIEWLCICWREGWLDGNRRNPGVATEQTAATAAARLMRIRTELFLNGSYGSKAPAGSPWPLKRVPRPDPSEPDEDPDGRPLPDDPLAEAEDEAAAAAAAPDVDPPLGDDVPEGDDPPATSAVLDEAAPAVEPPTVETDDLPF